MAYQIRYGETAVKRRIPDARRSRRTQRKWVAILCLSAAAVWLLSLKSVRSFLIPGDDEVTKAAFSVFTEELRAGEKFEDAAAAFCRHIIQSEQLA